MMIKDKALWPELFTIGFERRSSEELYDIKKDPYCLHDLSKRFQMQTIRKKMKQQLEQQLVAQKDPRMMGYGDVFDSYPRFGLMRPYDGFKERGKYNPAFIKK